MEFLFIGLFIVANFVDQVALFKHNDTLEYISKPLIVPSLLGLYFIYSYKYFSGQVSSMIITALIFHTLGDIFLMIKNKNVFFILGIVSFFTGHIFYMNWFARMASKDSLVFTIIISALFILGSLYIFKLILASKNPLGPLLFPYSFALIAFAVCIASTFSSQNIMATVLGIIGIALFSFSDSCIGLKALDIKDFSENSIMITYSLGQFLLITSALLLFSTSF
ncbi:MAG: lysoplasmalogenase family protein [Sphaerochaetaceae bacterium]|nr:lysoplasmalogenase family protein [Sphaerochaetaceae bacterium]